MNAMKRFLLGSSQGSADREQQQQQTGRAGEPTSSQQASRRETGPQVGGDVVVGIKPSPSQHAALSLTHLRKLYADLTSPGAQMLQEPEKEARIYTMLPLFCRVFSHCPPAEMVDKFPEVAGFCQQVSRLAVAEIRRRASNQSTVAASQAIAGFLEMDAGQTDGGECGSGWMLLTALNLLSAGGSALMEVMTAASVPSTLVKCLYLFFDLPDVPAASDPSSGDSLPESGPFSPKERRALLQKSIGQMLVRLASVPAAAEELARKDDLTLLFSALSSPCPTHNLPWRKTANEVLVVLTRHGLTALVLAYIHNKGCISLCVENMQKASNDLTPLELVEMFATVFCLLKDSTDVTQTLLDDFRACQGYAFLTESLLRAEQDPSTESQEALRNLVFLISSLAQVGFQEIRPPAGVSSTGSLFQLPNFTVPAPAGKGSSVRNVQAFQVLHNAFLKSGSGSSAGSASLPLASIVLDAVSTLFHADPANYFILETHNTLSQFAERIHTKSDQVQEKFFRLLEFVVFQLNYVPCKELISLSLLLRNHSATHPHCAIHCLLFLLTILRHHPIFKDVYREVGLLEVLVTCLQRFAGLTKLKTAAPEEEPPANKDRKDEDPEVELGYLVMECLAVLLPGGGGNNAAVFRQSGGARCAHNLVPYPQCRREALGLVQQLVLSAGGDDDMGTLLGLLQSAGSSPAQLPLRMDILKSLLTCLRESHRTRTMFRKVGGFVYVMSALVSMERCLSDGQDTAEGDRLLLAGQLRFLHLVFNTLCVAMRYEPANAKFFLQEICGPSLCDTIRLLGCFDLERTFDSPVPSADPDPGPLQKRHQEFHLIFNRGVLDFCVACEEGKEESGDEPGRFLSNAALVLRLLYDLAIDLYDRAQVSPACCSVGLRSPPSTPAPPMSPSGSGGTMTRSESGSTTFAAKRPAVSSLNLNSGQASGQPDPILVHPGVVLAMFQLLPSIWTDKDVEASKALQLLVTDIIQSLMANSERNVQILCDAGLPALILRLAGRSVLDDEAHYLHAPVLTVLEHLARQALDPKDLRAFLRMGNPLNCLLPVEKEDPSVRTGSAVPLHRIKSLVSMSTPRDVVSGYHPGRHHRSLFSPPFVEFDMQPEGFGCLFLPSVAPQSFGTGGPGSGEVGGGSGGSSSVAGGAGGGVMGGVGGGGDRVFPALSGMSYSTWICVDKFSDPRLDPHPIRLLTLVRNVNHPGGPVSTPSGGESETNLVCLSVVLSPRDKALLVSTQETALPKGSSDWEPDVSGDSGARIWNPDLIQEGHWHHLALVWSRAVLKSSQFSLYVDGQLVHTGKMHYISQNPGGAAATLTVASSVFGYIGTAPSWRRQSRLVWRQGPCHLVEDAFNPQVVQWIYRIGPHYVGSLQAPELLGSSGGALVGVQSGGVGGGTPTGSVEASLCSLVNEERIVFGLNASAMSPLTLAKIRKVYRKADSRSIAKQLGMSSHENATPIRLLHNAAGHLSGPARTLGGVVVGYLGVRVFCPRPIATTLQAVGGCSVLLGLVAMSTDRQSLYASVQALVTVLRSGGDVRHEMDRLRGYQTLAYLLKKHKGWLDRHILQLILSLVGCGDGQSTPTVAAYYSPVTTNSAAFRDLLADLDVWKGAGDGDLLKTLLELFYRLASDPSSWGATGSSGAGGGGTSGGSGSSTRYLRELNLVGRLLQILQEDCQGDAVCLPPGGGRETLWNLLGWLLHNNPRPVDLLQFGQYLAGTLPVSASCTSADADDSLLGMDNQQSTSSDSILLDDATRPSVLADRNDGLALLHKLFLVHDKAVNQLFVEEFLRVLGFDWLLLFAQPHIRSSSVVLSIRCLVLLLSCPPVLARFRSEGVTIGTAGSGQVSWTRPKEALVTAAQSASGSVAAATTSGPLRLVGRTFSVAAEDVQSSLQTVGQQQQQQPGQVAGFQLLSWLLVNQTALPDVYHLLIGLMAGKSQPRTSSQLDIETIWGCLSSAQQQSGSSSAPTRIPAPYCPEAIGLMLTMIRAVMNPEQPNELSAITSQGYPDVIVQFLFYVYNNSQDYGPVFMSTDIINALAACLFPPAGQQQQPGQQVGSGQAGSEPSTPVLEQQQYVLIETSGGSGGGSGKADSLTCHRAKKAVMDFLRTIVVDSLSLPVSSSTGIVPSPVGGSGSGGSASFQIQQPIIDVVLDACPSDSSSYGQQCQFQTEILSAVMEYLASAGTIIGEQSVLAVQQPGGSAQHVAPNVFYLAGRLVDKLWQAVLLHDPQQVFDLIIQLIGQSRSRRTGSTSGGSSGSSSSSSAGLSTGAMDNIYRVMNRCILYLLSRPADTVAGQMSVLETLRKLTTHRSLIMGSGNHDLEFIGCLTYCLLQLTNHMKISTEPLSKTTWHVPAEGDPGASDSLDGNAGSAHSSLKEAQHLAATAAQRVWEELYISKKPAIEEAFKISLGANTQHRAPSLELVRDPATKLWLSYVDAERRCVYRTVLEVSSTNQIQSKIQKVTGGLTRLTTRSLTIAKGGGKSSGSSGKGSGVDRSPSGRNLPGFNQQQMGAMMITSWPDVWLATQSHLAGLKVLAEAERRQRSEAVEHAGQYAATNWARVEEGELLRPRGLWGPMGECRLLTKWMLDATEAGPCRMRKKLTANPHFYALYPYRPELELAENKSLRYKVAVSLDAKDYHRLYGPGSGWRRSLLHVESGQALQAIAPVAAARSPVVTSAEEQPEESSEDMAARLKDIPLSRKNKPDADDEELAEEGPTGSLPTSANTSLNAGPSSLIPAGPSSSSSSAAQQDWQNLLRLLEEGEKIGHLFRCARVQGLETIDGLLLFGKDHLYVVDGFTQTPVSREIRDISNFPPGTFEPIVPPYTTPGYNQQASAFNRQQEAIKSSAVHQCSRLSYEDVREVHKRRYLLQPIALEIFSNDGRNHLLAFPPSGRNKVYQRLLATATGLSDSASQSVAGQKRAANVEQSAGILSTMTAGLMGETSVTQRWVRGELSNFQYLMHLNTLAGRSYNDLMQYPVFPWILADYDSAELDLSNPATFRDLSKPMGAQTPERMAQFRKRYKEWDDPHNETGPYHYGTHYSSAMIVCSYLVRLEPFTQQFLQLQGGHFDLADRLFHSVREAWWSAAQLNMADVKELIPEFFYLPDFLVNGNRFDLGCKQSGVALDDIVLPPWAKDDPREFIRLHRAALESEYVSLHLHEWIDLIFGHKQQGPAAVEAVNVFHPLFYEGNVDIYSIEDPLKKNAVIGFINNFGQTPKQLFKKPHPAKKVSASSGGEDHHHHHHRMSGLEMALPLAGQAIQMLPGALLPGAVAQVAGGALSDSEAVDRIFFHHVDHLSPSLQPIKELKRPVGHMVGLERSVVLAVEENKCLIPPSYTRCVAWGYADHSIRLLPHDSEKALMVCETPFHQEILTCVCPTARTVVTGGANSVVTVWELGKRSFAVRQHLYGHTEAVTCLAASAGYQILVSGSRDRTAIVWDLSRLTFIRQLTGHAAPLAAIGVNDLTGDMATCSGTWLHLWSINGQLLANVNTLVGCPPSGGLGRSSQHILCVCFSQHNEWDPQNVILTGSTDGVVRMWSLDYVQVPDESAQAPAGPSSSGGEQSAAAGLSGQQGKGSEDEGDEEEDEDSPDEEAARQEESHPHHGLLQRQPSFNSQASIENPAEGSSALDQSAEGAAEMRPSRSDTSLNATEFEVITESEVSEIKKAAAAAAARPPLAASLSTSSGQPAKKSRHVLKEGFKWQRQLIFRTKLTMHTAYDRQDNSDPASITSIAISKDHRTVLVGDARGRVHSWSVTDVSGRSIADHWLRDDAADSCTKCRVKFTLTERRHHCRNCGHVFCSRCSRYESEIMQLRIRRPVRVCQGCYNSLKASGGPSTSSDGTS